MKYKKNKKCQVKGKEKKKSRGKEDEEVLVSRNTPNGIS